MDSFLLEKRREIRRLRGHDEQGKGPPELVRRASLSVSDGDSRRAVVAGRVGMVIFTVSPFCRGSQ